MVQYVIIVVTIMMFENVDTLGLGLLIDKNEMEFLNQNKNSIFLSNRCLEQDSFRL